MIFFSIWYDIQLYTWYKKKFGFGLPIKKSKKNLKSRILKKKSLTLFSNMVYRLPVNKTGPYTPLFFCPPQPKQPHLCTFFEGRKKAKDMRWLTSLILSWRFCFSKESCLVGPQSNLRCRIFRCGI